MRLLPAILLLPLVGCMSRPGMIDCTTNRAYPAYSKPLCGGPFDPFVWVMGDCNCCCRGAMKCSYTPYGGRTCFGEDMKYIPGCVAPPLQWSPPAMPAPPGGHTVHLPDNCPPPLSPRPPAPAAEKKETATPPAPALTPAPSVPAPEAVLPADDSAVPELPPPVSSGAAALETPEGADAGWQKPEIIRDARVEPRDSSRL